MPYRPSEPESPVSLGPRPGLSHDSRQGLGYGLSNDMFHKAREKNSSFPYNDESQDQLEDVDIDVSDDLLTKILNKIQTPYKSSDALISRSKDHSSFANGNRPVAIGEASGKSLVPFPGMYKKRMQVGGGVNSPKLIAPGQYNMTGTSRGWSHAHVPYDSEPRDNEELTQDEEGLQKIRDIVRMVLKSNSNSV